jgi:hypothetical protein
MLWGKLDMTNNQTKQGVYHTMALPFLLKSILRQKEELPKIQRFHHAKM